MDDFEKAFAEFSAKRAGDEPEPTSVSADADLPEQDASAGKLQIDAPAAEPQLAAQDAEPLATPPGQEAAPSLSSNDSEKPPAPAKPRRLEDLLELLPASEREQFKPLVETAVADQRKFRSDVGRAAAMQRLYETSLREKQEAQAKVTELEAKLQAAPTPEKREQIQAQIAEEQDTLARDYPELSEALTLRLKRELAKVQPQDASPPAPTPAAQPAQVASAEAPEVTALATEYVSLAEKHPDWQEAVKSDWFATWFKGQPPGVQALLDSPRAQDAIWMLDTAKKTLEQAQRRAASTRTEQSRQRLEQHVGVRGSPPKAPGIPDDFDSAFEFYAKKREREAQKRMNQS